MALKPFYTDAESIPEDAKDFYRETEDATGFVLDVESEDGYALENVASLKSALGRLKEDSRTAQSSLKEYKALNLSAKELTDALSELENLRNAQGDEGERIAALRLENENFKKSAKAEMEKAIAPIESLANSRLEQIKELLIDAKLQASIVEQGGSPKLLMPVLKNEVRAITNDDGKVVVEIIDGDGSPRVSGADLAPMSFADLVKEKKTDKELAVAFKASGASGAGIEPEAETASVVNGQRRYTPEDVGNMSPSEYRRARENNLITA